MTMDRFAYALYCDDIRHEVGGKFSLIGCYRGDLIVVGDLPATLPKLCVAVWISTDIENPIKKASIRILQNEDEILSTELDVSSLEMLSGRGGDRNRMAISAQVVLSSFKIERTGVLRTLIEVDGETLRAGGLILGAQEPEIQGQLT